MGMPFSCHGLEKTQPNGTVREGSILAVKRIDHSAVILTESLQKNF